MSALLSRPFQQLHQVPEKVGGPPGELVDGDRQRLGEGASGLQGRFGVAAFVAADLPGVEPDRSRQLGLGQAELDTPTPMTSAVCTVRDYPLETLMRTIKSDKRTSSALV